MVTIKGLMEDLVLHWERESNDGLPRAKFQIDMEGGRRLEGFLCVEDTLGDDGKDLYYPALDYQGKTEQIGEKVGSVHQAQVDGEAAIRKAYPSLKAWGSI